MSVIPTIELCDDGSAYSELLKASQLPTFYEFILKKREILAKELPLAEGVLLRQFSVLLYLPIKTYRKRPLKEWYGIIYTTMQKRTLKFI